MKTPTITVTTIRCLLFSGLIAFTGHVRAQAPAHYIPGVEGINVGTLPPPGFYLRDYNVFYGSGQLNDPAGTAINAANLNTFVYAQVPRFIWITDLKFLGGNFGIDGFLPLIEESTSINTPKGKFDSNTFGIGDLLADASLSWHPGQFDFILCAGFFAPTGNSSAPPTTDVGGGFWSSLISWGGTWHIDKDRTWAISAVNRFEDCSEQQDTHIQPGNVYNLEWAVSKAIVKTVDLGVVGYYQQKITADSGPGAVAANNRVAAVGPEVVFAFPKEMLSVSFRYNYEFMAEGRAQGSLGTLSLTKRF